MTAFHRTDGPAGKMPMLADHLEILGMTKQADDLRKFIADHARLSAESADLTKALTGLTCGGSEFFVRQGDRYVADIPACVAWVRRAKEDAHRRSVDALKRAKAAEAEVARLSALVEGQGRALAELDDAMLDVREAFIRDGTYSGKKGAAIKRMNAAITQARAARTSKGADND